MGGADASLMYDRGSRGPGAASQPVTGQGESTMSRRLALRAGSWALASGTLLVAGFILLAGALTIVSLARTGVWRLSTLQLGIGRLLLERVLVEGLLPHLMVTLATWLAAARLAPALDATWGRVVAGTALAAAVWFPVIGHYCFLSWTPETASDYANTLLLMTGGVTLAMLLPRGLARSLRPGCFARDA